VLILAPTCGTIAAAVQSANERSLGEIKWQKRPVGVKTLQELRKKAKPIKTISSARHYFLLVSKSGFTRSLEQIADEGVLLLDLRKGFKAS